MIDDPRMPLVLIVDDSPENIRILTGALRGHFELAAASNGIEALEYVRERLPDVVLLDIVMPGKNGYEVCSCLRNDGRTKDVPVIFISALDEITDKTKGFDAGAVDYVTKPFDVVEVRARVGMHLELKKAREELKEQNLMLNELSTKLSKYLSPQIYDSIFSGKKDAKLETRRKNLTVFFSDIQAFTEMTDHMEAETLTYVLNEYLNEMSEVTLRHGGTLDKFVGDSILIFFGDPETRGVKEDALACIRMAIDMRERLKFLRKKWADEGVTRLLHVRMGITTGYCTVGNFGSENRLEYTIIGGQVNLANRLQSLAQPGQILISQETYALLKKEIISEKKDEIRVRGIAYPIQTYQVIDLVENYPKTRSRLKEDMERFLLSLDYENLAEADKRQLIDTLEITVADIKASTGSPDK